ncbi:hypothetical protein PILCRDRAFT_279105 [Piloderma croceum F 1598]|uniref:Uncharacterized protein n=1 Tax=Piloderma croceum (strain F 1598) TaxID=765440 RepID=A0A0C3G6Q9_PILCF|nr:hypothetical protein PILCRDRAFT_279105 [Piloderma croceum F 1598]
MHRLLSFLNRVELQGLCEVLVSNCLYIESRTLRARQLRHARLTNNVIVRAGNCQSSADCALSGVAPLFLNLGPDYIFCHLPFKFMVPVTCSLQGLRPVRTSSMNVAGNYIKPAYCPPRPGLTELPVSRIMSLPQAFGVSLLACLRAISTKVTMHMPLRRKLLTVPIPYFGTLPLTSTRLVIRPAGLNQRCNVNSD